MALDLKKRLKPTSKVDFAPGLTIHEPSILAAHARSQRDANFGHCPSCGVVAILHRPELSHTVDSLNETASPSAAYHELQLDMVCGLCLIAKDSFARRVAVWRGLIWFMIGTPSSPSQIDINRNLWTIIHRSEYRYRQDARAQLRAQLALEDIGKGLKLPHEALSPEELKITQTYVQDRMGLIARRALSQANLNAIIGTFGVEHLLANIANPPLWQGTERFFPTPNGVEYFAKEVAENQGKRLAGHESKYY